MMDERRVVKAKPPPMITTFLPSSCSQGYQLPMGPRMPMTSPTFMLCRWVVTRPTLLTVNLTKPFSTGDEAMPMGISPLPVMDNSANWPGW
jgi:hypothetical protein